MPEQLTMFPRPERPALTPAEIALPPELDTPEVRTALEKWLAYKQTRGECYKSAPALKRIFRPFLNAGPRAFCASVDHSISLNWQGIHPWLPEISQAELGDIRSVLAWRELAAIDKTVATEVRVVAAAMMALEKGNPPVSLFRWVVREKKWDHVNDTAMEEARRRLAEHRRRRRPAGGAESLESILAGILG
jgi:hypothetical protein